MKLRMFKMMAMVALAVPAILPTSCNQALLKELTPFLIDGGNSFLVDVIFTAAPFVL